MTDINLPPLPRKLSLSLMERADLYEWCEYSIRAAVLADREARGEPVAILRRDAKVGLLRVRYTDEVTEVPDGEHPLYLAPQPVEQRDEQAAFETWARSQVGFGTYDKCPDYALGAVRDAWEVWQARAAFGVSKPVEQRNPLSDEQIKDALSTVSAAVFEMMHGTEISVIQFRTAMTEVIRAIERAHGITGDPE